MRTRLNILTLAAAVIGLLLIPATAFAYAPSGDDFITCVEDPELHFECSAGIFDPNTDVDVLVEINPVLLDTTVTADENGEIDFEFDVPEDEEGEVTVSLTGTKNGETFTMEEDVATVTEDGEVIAETGSDAGLLAIGAVGAIALGGAALAVSRRKTTGTTA